MRRPLLLARGREKVLVLDGGMGTSILAAGLSADDFRGHPGCNEALVISRPDLIAGIHAGYLDAGSDVVETNTFGGSRIVLSEHGLGDRTFELNREAARLARKVAADFARPEQPRYVLGSVGPGSKLPSLGHIGFDALRDAFVPQVEGLVAGGVDAVCIETCQDLLQVKAAVLAAREAFVRQRKRVPLFASITIEASGAMLLGTDVATAAAALVPLGIDVLGLNCATGPAEMERFAEHLSQHGPARLMAMPNAGFPENVGGRMVYRLPPAEFAGWVEGFVKNLGIGIVGGCCGTDASHIRELARRVGGLPVPRRRAVRRPLAASLYQAVSLRQVPAPAMVGERTNANGSKEFRRCLLADDLPGMLAVAKDQESGGAHLLDVCVAYAGRNEAEDLPRLVRELATRARLPVMLDSTNPDAIEAALKRYGGRCLINSVNLEDGGAKLDRVARLARQYGAGLVALAIDEQGMAMTAQRKCQVAERLQVLLTGKHGLHLSDLVFDLLTFTVGSGDPATAGAAFETLEALARRKRTHPKALTLLGVSNVSYGLAPAARRVLTSVFLHEAAGRGLDLAIVNPAGILPLFRIPEEWQAAARRVLLNDRSAGDPLAAFLALFESGEDAQAAGPAVAQQSPAERLSQIILDGSGAGLAELLDSMLGQGRMPAAIINGILIPAMQQVGKLFGQGKMQLPFVLQSAETMRKAVALLEPRMDRAATGQRGTLVLATVRGDVHDIGKDLVDVIVSNNGYKVVNLGTRVPVEEMLKAASEHRATAIGMSGLLVNSTWVMKENLEEMARRGMRIPVLLGGAALTPQYVENDLRPIYGEHVHYCKDAFDAVKVLEGCAGASSPSPGLRPPPPAEGEGIVSSGGRGGDSPFPVPRSPGSLGPPLPIGRGRDADGQGSDGSEWLEPKAVCGWFPCASSGNDLHVRAPETGETIVFSFPRKKSEPHLCVADWFRPLCEGMTDQVGFFVVTVGSRAKEQIALLFARGELARHLALHQLAVRSAEAAARWMHRGMLDNRRPGVQVIAPAGLEHRGRGRLPGQRFSFGFTVCPDLSEQRKLFHLLRPEHIGVTLTETFQMLPEFTVSALVVPHPEARHFSLD